MHQGHCRLAWCTFSRRSQSDYECMHGATGSPASPTSSHPQIRGQAPTTLTSPWSTHQRRMPTPCSLHASLNSAQHPSSPSPQKAVQHSPLLDTRDDPGRRKLQPQSGEQDKGAAISQAIPQHSAQGKVNNQKQLDFSAGFAKPGSQHACLSWSVELAKPAPSLPAWPPQGHRASSQAKHQPQQSRLCCALQFVPQCPASLADNPPGAQLNAMHCMPVKEICRSLSHGAISCNTYSAACMHIADPRMCR